MRVGLVALVMAVAFMSGAPLAADTTHPAPILFKPLDVVVPHVLVTAMAFAPDGTIYAAGRYMVRDPDPYATPPWILLEACGW